MSSFKRLNINSAPALAGIAGPLILVVGDLAASLSTPNYSMISNSISSLALTPLGWLQTVGFLVMGLLVEVFVAGLFFNIRRARGFHLGIGLLVCLGFGLLLIGAFRMDPAGWPSTIEGTIHSATAYALSLLFPIAILLLAPSLKSDPNWKGTFVYTLVAGVLALALTMGLLWLPERMGWFGLYQRIVVANVIIWVEVIAVHLLRLSLRQQPKP
ncbi:MAG: DUF998 domain-containing protein [Dehalococcoidia bacterium]|nr:MAG: DUF998 domain-containing protein [Dehalococcoidia bacterium]